VRALVTGASGFVGRYLCAELRSRGAEVIETSHAGEGALRFDLRDAAAVASAVADARADVVFHLAAQASVSEAAREPVVTYDVNVLGTARLIDAVRALPQGRRPLLVFASSSEVYGPHPVEDYPLTEAAATRPVTIYAASKVAAEAIVFASAHSFGVRAIVARSFNAIGPGQSDRYAVSAFALRLARIAKGGPPLFPVGNLESQRDFIDVRDVARAYADLAERGVAGETYNVGSGVPTRMKDVLRQLVMAARVGVEIREDPALMRAADVPLLYGDTAKLKAATGWSPAFALPRSLRDIYEDALARTVAA
jgi:GDP-4-dehydro-6-deoxy-D-mannose reductase